MDIRDVAQLVKAVRADIQDDYRAFEEDERPSIKLTVAANTLTGAWTFQTGDNSYFGNCYFYQHWGVAGGYRDSNCYNVAKDLVEQVKAQIAESRQY